MITFLKSQWALHPWLTALEVAALAVVAVELFLLAHVMLGWLWGVFSGSPDAMSGIRFIFMTGADANFGAGLVALLALLPLGLLLLVFAVAGAGLALWSGAPLRPFVEAAGADGAMLLVGLVLFFAGGVFGGGILPH
jgi:hypothetical protein